MEEKQFWEEEPQKWPYLVDLVRVDLEDDVRPQREGVVLVEVPERVEAEVRQGPVGVRAVQHPLLVQQANREPGLEIRNPVELRARNNSYNNTLSSFSLNVTKIY